MINLLLESSTIVNIPVCYEKVLGLLKTINFGNNIVSYEALVNSIQNFSITTLSNKIAYDININKPFEIDLLDPNEIHFIDEIYMPF